MNLSDKVVFTGHAYRIAKIFRYDLLFKDKVFTIKEIKRDCCNQYLIFKEIEGAYSEKLFHHVNSTPVPP
ncbi:hypothetical protein [Anaerosacchariphilus polymeriproducens]|uniref:Uncharacterized protein n=1 Tax=Anaerosacchariphilus polymeriproducens TaxID=1812858 RepID=A0A371ARK0_9FIRM|nr:hypothetical protein [Anaerosacchariphilus polymeriproducens]RDU22199.1 hypothetical protein DWV06_16880 [Anaerosacchariphilus polymeriproducens]